MSVTPSLKATSTSPGSSSMRSGLQTASSQAPSIGPNRPTGRGSPSRMSSGCGWPAQMTNAERASGASPISATVHGVSSTRVASAWLSCSNAAIGSPSSMPAVRSVWRACPVSAAASAPRPVTSPTRSIQPFEVGNAS